MLIAHIYPPDWVGLFPAGSYRMALAHWVFQYPAYAGLMRKGPAGQKAYIVMDSGSFEGEQVTIEKLNEAALALKADEVVLSDVPGDYKATLKRSWEALDQVTTKRVMFVPQGRTHEEWRTCLTLWLDQWAKHNCEEKYQLSIGVASLREQTSTKSVTGTKAALLGEVQGLNYPIHLLGLPHLGNHVKDILPRAHATGIRGIDTSTAFALGARGILVTPSAEKIRLGDPGQYEALNTPQRRLIRLNIAILDAWTQGGEGSVSIPTKLLRELASRWKKYWQEGFTSLEEVMLACGMPSGKYALLKENNREVSVRPGRPEGEEIDVRI